MKRYALSSTTFPVNAQTVATVQATGTDAPSYAMRNTTPPANFSAGSGNAPTVYALAVEAARRRRRGMILIT